MHIESGAITDEVSTIPKKEKLVKRSLKDVISQDPRYRGSKHGSQAKRNTSGGKLDQDLSSSNPWLRQSGAFKGTHNNTSMMGNYNDTFKFTGTTP